jgi:hypothetical protein
MGLAPMSRFSDDTSFRAIAKVRKAELMEPGGMVELARLI